MGIINCAYCGSQNHKTTNRIFRAEGKDDLYEEYQCLNCPQYFFVGYSSFGVFMETPSHSSIVIPKLGK